MKRLHENYNKYRKPYMLLFSDYRLIGCNEKLLSSIRVFSFFFLFFGTKVIPLRIVNKKIEITWNSTSASHVANGV